MKEEFLKILPFFINKNIRKKFIIFKMLDKFTQVYAQLIAESVSSKKKLIKKGCKSRCKGKKSNKLFKEQSGDPQTLVITYFTDVDGITCQSGPCSGFGRTLEVLG